MRTVILAVLFFLPLFSQASYEDFRLSIFSDHSNLITVEIPRAKAASMFYRLVNENNGTAQVIRDWGNSRTLRARSTQHPLFSCELTEVSFNGPYSNTYDCAFNVFVNWSTYRSALPTDYQEIKDYTFDYSLSRPFQWKGAPAKALFEQLAVSKYQTEKSEVVGATTIITRTVSNLGCELKNDSQNQEYSCWIEN